MSLDSGPPKVDPALPTLQPPARGANWRTTGLIAGALVVLVLLKLVTSHPPPTPSHQTPAAAALGYVDALRASNLTKLESYLPPSERNRAASELGALRADHVLLVSPAIQGALGQGSPVTVNLTVEICYRRSSRDHYNCQLLQREPLGLPSELQAVEVGGRWYVSTLLEPQPLG